MSRYLVIIEPNATGVSAYSPDLPGSVATGPNRPEVESEMREAIGFHLDGMRLEGIAIPNLRSEAAFCQIVA